MLLTCEEMKQVEEAAFARGVSAEALMDQAGLAIADVVSQFFPAPSRAIAFCGKGNNAGDVLVAARHLAERGWEIETRLAFPESSLAPLPANKLTELRRTAPRSPFSLQPSAFSLILDGLLGIGASGHPREPIATAIREINRLRLEAGAFVVAADIPSGLDGDSGEPGDPCVTADCTVTIAHAKPGLLSDRATGHAGRLALADLPPLGSQLATHNSSDSAELITPAILCKSLPPRDFDSHKGTWGRIGIIAGSRGFLGAARLCASAAVRAGGGLVTLYARPDAYELLAATCQPEVMVKCVNSYTEALGDKLDSIGLGPGLGSNCDEEIFTLIREAQVPMVIDADGLNALSRSPSQLAALDSRHLLTPHPGEMARLFPKSKSLTRRQAAEEFVAAHPVTLLLKGARTVIAEKGRPLAFNTTGNPGMGSGGMGDILTGVCATLLAQRHPPRTAAMLGAWLCGRAAESYVFSSGGSPESLCASDVLGHLGRAFTSLRTNSF